MSDARAYARRRCAEHRVDADRCDALELAMSELVGNALRHAGPPVAYEVAADGADLVLTVTDGDPRPPGSGRDRGLDAEGGRGLFLIGQLSRGWGWELAGGGKRVWARI